MITQDTQFFKDSLIIDLLSSLKEGVVITTPSLEAPHPLILFVNDYTLKATGYTLEELVGQSPRVLQGDQTNQAMMGELKENLKQGLPFTGETVNYRKDGTSYQVEINLRPIFDNRGEVLYYLGIQRDITAEKEARESRLQAEAYQMEIEAQKRLKENLTGFIASLTRQLRDPLSVIRLNAESLQRYGSQLPQEKHETKLETIITSVDSLVALLNDVMIVSDISKPDANRSLTVRRTSVDACQVSHDIIHNIQEQFPQRLEDLILHYPENCDPVQLDARLLNHIISHLVLNALIYSNEGTPVDVTIEQTEDTILIVISDKGKGISAEEQAKLFEPFYRASNANGTQGTGLGLTIVNSSVQALNGNIEFESEEGKGTRVCVSLPVERDSRDD